MSDITFIKGSKIQLIIFYSLSFISNFYALQKIELSNSRFHISSSSKKVYDMYLVKIVKIASSLHFCYYYKISF